MGEDGRNGSRRLPVLPLPASPPRDRKRHCPTRRIWNGRSSSRGEAVAWCPPTPWSAPSWSLTGRSSARAPTKARACRMPRWWPSTGRARRSRRHALHLARTLRPPRPYATVHGRDRARRHHAGGLGGPGPEPGRGRAGGTEPPRPRRRGRRGDRRSRGPAAQCGFAKHVRTGMPFVIWKAAASLDGKVAARDGSSRWVTGEAARADVHRLRAWADAIVVGAGTALADDPELTVRDPDYRGRPPLRSWWTRGVGWVRRVTCSTTRRPPSSRRPSSHPRRRATHGARPGPRSWWWRPTARAWGSPRS